MQLGNLDLANVRYHQEEDSFAESPSDIVTYLLYKRCQNHAMVSRGELYNSECNGAQRRSARRKERGWLG